MSSNRESPAARHVAVDVRRFPWIRRLAADYVFDYGAVAPFFAGDPRDPGAWTDAIRRAQAHTRSGARDGIADVLLAQQRTRRAPAAASAAAERLRHPDTVAIVTGQQAGLFGGPLFTLLKALTALKLAECVTRKHGVETVAVFWIDAEDHDWPEVASCQVLDAELRVQTVTLATPPGAGEMPVAHVRLDASIARAIEELTAALPSTEFTANLIASLGQSYRPGVGMADAFGSWLESALGSLGLVVFDAADPAAKPIAQSIFAREIRSPGATSRLAAVAGADLLARGYHAQAHPPDGGLALFHLEDGRHAIRQQGDAFVIGDATRPASVLIDEVSAAPGRFSPNVLLRPLVQDTLFPTICYVSGPNELGYLGQLKAVYEHFGVPMPLVYPRATATLVDSGAFKFLTRHDLPLESLQPRDEAALNHLLAAQLPPSVDRAMQATLEAVEARMSELIPAVKVIDPTLAGAAHSTLGRLRDDLHKLQTKIIQAAKRRDETLRRQFTRTQALAFPGGQPQERALGFVYFLNKYGPALVDRLLAELPLDMGSHWVVTI